MANEVINDLIEERIDTFLAAFTQRAKALFHDDTKKNGLRHPGEFGTYRESIVADLLQGFLPQHLAIDTGFIVNSSGEVSKQIDLIIYNPFLTPPLESKRRQRFFPVETVVAVGEVRSSVSKPSFNEALQRISEVKELRLALNSESSAVIRWDGLGSTKYDPDAIPFDQIFTFLICKRFDFPLQHRTFVTTLNESYGDIDYGRRHNAVLSIDDGLLYYSGELPTGERADTYFPTSPIDNKPNQNKWILRHDNQYVALKIFCANIFMHACHCTVGYADLAQYHQVGKHHFWTETIRRQQ